MTSSGQLAADLGTTLFDNRWGGDHYTALASNGAVGPWIQIDMGEPRYVSGMTFIMHPRKLNFELQFKDIRVFISNQNYDQTIDGIGLKTVVYVTDPTSLYATLQVHISLVA